MRAKRNCGCNAFSRERGTQIDSFHDRLSRLLPYRLQTQRPAKGVSECGVQMHATPPRANAVCTCMQCMQAACGHTESRHLHLRPPPMHIIECGSWRSTPAVARAAQANVARQHLLNNQRHLRSTSRPTTNDVHIRVVSQRSTSHVAALMCPTKQD